MRRYTIYLSPLGPLTLVSAGAALTELRLDGSVPADAAAGLDPVLGAACAWLDGYFRGEDPPVDFPLAPAGTAFQQAVWRLLEAIPRGATRTYGEIAGDMAAPLGKERMAPQAVGGAVGRNPIAIIIPCHRVVGAGGSLTGYAGGLEKKRWLLTYEGSLPQK